jgi:uncharacterized protein YceK
MASLEPAGQSVISAPARLLGLVLLLMLALASAGCADINQSADDQMNAYHSTGDQEQSAGDDHGWGANLSGVGGQH